MGFFLLSSYFLWGWVSEKERDSDLCQGLKTVSGGLFSLQMTSTSLHNNTHQPGVCSSRNQVSSWTRWKTVPSAQEAESTGLCCPNKFFSKALCHITCVSVSWGPLQGETLVACTEVLILTHSCFQKSRDIPLPDHRITLLSDKTFVFLHKLILWYNSSPRIQTNHFTTGSCTAVGYKWPVQVTSDSYLIHAAM